MECIFKGVNTKLCGLQQKCIGIYALIKELGGDEEFANLFSQYIWYRSIFNKIQDTINDPTLTIKGKIKKKVAKLSFPFIKRRFMIENSPFEQQLRKIEKEVRIMEENEIILQPMDYYYKVGEAYALIFSHAGKKASKGELNLDLVSDLGFNLGALVALRDSIHDLKKDRLSRSFNPFKKWKPAEISVFYQTHAKILIDNIKTSLKKIENYPSIARIEHLTGFRKIKVGSALGSLFLYAEFSSNPQRSCRNDPQASNMSLTLSDISSLFCGYWSSDCWYPILGVLFGFICCCSCLSSCCSRSNRDSTRSSSGCDGGSSGCDCGATDCGDCGCGDCGDCGGCDCGGCDAGGCDC